MNRHLMITLISIAGLIALFLVLPQPEPTDDAMPASSADTAAERTLIGPVRVFDGEQIREAQYVVLKDGLIESVESLAPEGMRSILDTSGKTLIPGLIDAHTHTWGSALEDALPFGVTTELDMFTDHRFAAQQRNSNGALDGPLRADLYSAGTLVTAPGGHGTEYGVQIPVIEGSEQAEQFVADRIAEGSDYIKLVYNAAEARRQAFPSISRETMQAVIMAAHDQGRLAVVHVSNHVSAEHVVEADADALVHTFMDQPVSDTLLEQMIQRGVFIIPTLAVNASAVNGSGAKGLLEDPTLSELAKPSTRAALASRFPDFGIPDQALQTALDNTRRMHEAGVPVLAGTDAPNPGTAHGISLHRELELLVTSGLNPLDALSSATRLPAKHFGLSDRGRIEAGMIADLVLVEGRPDEDILATRRIVQVWKTGRLWRENVAGPETDSLTLSASGLLSDFSDGSLATTVGEGFVETTDQMMNGASQASAQWSKEGGGVLRIQGQVNKGVSFPWSGVYFQVALTDGVLLDVAEREQIVFRVRGTTGHYTLMLFTNGVMMPFRTTFEVRPEWNRVSIPLQDFSGADLREVTGLAWVRTDLIDSFEMVLDDIRIQ